MARVAQGSGIDLQVLIFSAVSGLRDGARRRIYLTILLIVFGGPEDLFCFYSPLPLRGQSTMKYHHTEIAAHLRTGSPL